MHVHVGEGPVWRQSATLRGNTNDVQDIAWSPDASALLSGGVENECMVFDVEARKMAVSGMFCCCCSIQLSAYVCCNLLSLTDIAKT